MEKHRQLVELANSFALLTEGNKVYGPFRREQDGRSIVIVRDENGKTRTVSYPKYLMEQHLGRQLDPNKETVDHIDLNKDNNALDNLRVIDRSEHSALDTKRVKLIDLTCDWCKKPFQRSPRLLRDKNKKGVSGTFCSRPCSGAYSRAVQLGKMEKLPVQPFMPSEYFRRKEVAASLKHLFAKYSV